MVDGLCGFTLAEVVLVLVIVSVVAAIAVPRYANALAGYRVKLAAARIATDLSLARRQAKFGSAGQTVIFDATADTYRFPGLLDPNHSGQDYEVRLAEEPYGADLVSVSLGGDSQIVFGGFGLPDSGGSIVVQVGAYQQTVTIDANTGRAQSP